VFTRSIRQCKSLSDGGVLPTFMLSVHVSTARTVNPWFYVFVGIS